MENVSTLSKIVYDKTADYLKYYTFGNSNKIVYDDSLNDYDINFKRLENLNQIEDTNNSNSIESRRIFKSVGFFAEYYAFFQSPTHIIDNIYLGSSWNALKHSTLKENNFNVIVNMSKEIRNNFPDEFEYYKCGIYDNNIDSICDDIIDLYDYIILKQNDLSNDTPSNILIHCYIGASRSVSVVIYYLCRNHGFSIEESIEFIRKKRPHTNPTKRLIKDVARALLKTHK